MVCEAHRDVGKDHLEQIPQEVRLRPELACGTHTTKRISLVFHVDDLLLAGTHQIISEVLAELSRRPGTQE